MKKDGKEQTDKQTNKQQLSGFTAYTFYSSSAVFWDDSNKKTAESEEVYPRSRKLAEKFVPKNSLTKESNRPD